jgi:quercetin dioxygenase-like cupin family protein
MQRSLGIVAIAGLTLMPLLAVAQSPSSAARAREGFSGNLVVLNKGAPESVAVNYRIWFIPEGATVDDLASGAGGNLVVEVASGFLTAIVDGQRQPKQFGEFFVVPAGHKLQIVTANRSAILRTLQLGQ